MQKQGVSKVARGRIKAPLAGFQREIFLVISTREK